MFKIKRLYRENYAGEEVTTKLTYKGGKWEHEKDFIDNNVTNTRLSSQAIVLAGGRYWQDDHPQHQFDPTHIKNHKGGILGANKLQIYATNSVYKKIVPDFLVVDLDHAEQAVNDGITSECIVYAHANSLLDYPGRFYLIPQDPPWNAGTVAAYMACFDGHKKVFLLGFDGRQEDDAFYEQSLAYLLDMYSDVEFVRVCPTPEFYMPESWKYYPNLSQVDYRGFVLAADLG